MLKERAGLLQRLHPEVARGALDPVRVLSHGAWGMVSMGMGMGMRYGDMGHEHGAWGMGMAWAWGIGYGAWA